VLGIHPNPFPKTVQSVLGDLSHETMGITDTHNHVYIERIAGSDPTAPVLDQFDLIHKELLAYKAAGGGSILDCQPGGCGRNANHLVELSRLSGVNIVACTGFHRRKYYSPKNNPFALSDHQSAELFIGELTEGMEETLRQKDPVRAGFIKIALEASWSDCPQALLEGSAEAASKTGALLQIHTEKGALAEKAVIFLGNHGVKPIQLVICHIDKRLDFGIHQELAKFGVLLEYDTFYRPKYEPRNGVWPLVKKMIQSGLSGSICLATDMAEPEMYAAIGGGPGLASLPGAIKNNLDSIGIAEIDIRKVLGGNIARRLAGLN
jgi:predicted metal-dependent phosphotriesterase family hydrolase